MFNKHLSRSKQLAIIFLVLVLSMSMLVGCGSNDQAPTTPTEETTNEESTTRVITDMAGREVEIPTEINKVYSTNPISQIYLYTIDPGKIIGLNFELTDFEEKYSVEGYGDLPVLGGWFGKDNKGNIEEILKAEPDVIVTTGDMSEGSKSDAEDLQEQIGLPVVIMDGELENVASAYDFLGEVLNEKERAKELGDYSDKTLKQAKEIEAKMKDEEKTTVYYAQGPEGLETDPAGSNHAGLLDTVGGNNIADVEMKSGYGRTEVSIEQILGWDPEVIIVNKGTGEDSNSYQTIMTDSKWSNLKAVKEKRVYEIPNAPYDFFDRPPSVNRIIGVKWLGNLLYPELYDYDIEEEIKEFYKMFYHYEIQDGDLEDILGNAKSK